MIEDSLSAGRTLSRLCPRCFAPMTGPHDSSRMGYPLPLNDAWGKCSSCEFEGGTFQIREIIEGERRHAILPASLLQCVQSRPWLRRCIDVFLYQQGLEFAWRRTPSLWKRLKLAWSLVVKWGEE